MLTDMNAVATSVYCERTSPAFWSEPLNATTSLFVILVAGIRSVGCGARGLLSPTVIVLMILAVAIGIGSFLLHAFATVWAELADVLPIWSFVVVYGLLALRSLHPTGSACLATTLCLGVFGSGVALAIGDPTGMTASGMKIGFSGSAQYVPATLMIGSVAWFLWKARHPSLLRLGLGVGLFGLALAFRSLDMLACDSVPTGTHFLWHVTNCVVFWYLIEGWRSTTQRLPDQGAPHRACLRARATPAPGLPTLPGKGKRRHAAAAFQGPGVTSPVRPPCRPAPCRPRSGHRRPRPPWWRFPAASVRRRPLSRVRSRHFGDLGGQVGGL
ncbi:MAG: hypothetical protein IPL38_09400, partial [Rhodobacter sp.]|nr:hypothetical protein [Rhodobacter sp.]